MSQDVDEDEHSLEMHIPYIYKMLSKYVVGSSVAIDQNSDISAGFMATTSLLWSL